MSRNNDRVRLWRPISPRAHLACAQRLTACADNSPSQRALADLGPLVRVCTTSTSSPWASQPLDAHTSQCTNHGYRPRSAQVRMPNKPRSIASSSWASPLLARIAPATSARHLSPPSRASPIGRKQLQVTWATRPLDARALAGLASFNYPYLARDDRAQAHHERLNSRSPLNRRALRHACVVLTEHVLSAAHAQRTLVGRLGPFRPSLCRDHGSGVCGFGHSGVGRDSPARFAATGHRCLPTDSSDRPRHSRAQIPLRREIDGHRLGSRAYTKSAFRNNRRGAAPGGFSSPAPMDDTHRESQPAIVPETYSRIESF